MAQMVADTGFFICAIGGLDSAAWAERSAVYLIAEVDISRGFS